jgi:RNA polymerase sigma-70 factor (ECF subfamily)
MKAELLSSELRRRALRVATKIVGKDDAEDMVQNAYLSALKTAHPFSGASEAFTWFCRVTMNHCFMHLRKSKRTKEQTVEEMPEPHAKEIPADMFIHREETSRHIQRAIHSLKDSEKSDVLAVYFQYADLTISEVAKIRGKTTLALKSSIYRGRRELANILQCEQAA